MFAFCGYDARMTENSTPFEIKINPRGPKNFQWMVVRGSLLPLKSGTAYSYIEAERLAKKAIEVLEQKDAAKKAATPKG